jgi:hypothetical protein
LLTGSTALVQSFRMFTSQMIVNGTVMLGPVPKLRGIEAVIVPLPILDKLAVPVTPRAPVCMLIAAVAFTCKVVFMVAASTAAQIASATAALLKNLVIVSLPNELMRGFRAFWAKHLLPTSIFGSSRRQLL